MDATITVKPRVTRVRDKAAQDDVAGLRGTCPVCAAPVGKYCVRNDGTPFPGVGGHVARILKREP